MKPLNLKEIPYIYVIETEPYIGEFSFGRHDRTIQDIVYEDVELYIDDFTAIKEIISDNLVEKIRINNARIK